MSLYQSLKQRLAQPAVPVPVREDVNQQLGLLLYKGFLRHTPMSQVLALPRYLKAITQHLDKLKPDNADVQGLQRLSKHFWQAVMDQDKKQQQPQPERDEFRWALEELRVSIFAQNLKTFFVRRPLCASS